MKSTFYEAYTYIFSLFKWPSFQELLYVKKSTTEITGTGVSQAKCSLCQCQLHCKEFKAVIPPRENHMLVSSSLDLPDTKGEGTPHPLSLLSRALSEA